MKEIIERHEIMMDGTNLAIGCVPNLNVGSHVGYMFLFTVFRNF